MNYKEQYDLWVNSSYFDQETKDELLKIKDNEKEIEDRFYTDLKFGTAGIRGEIAAGTNRINKYVVRRTTQGLADYILKTGEEKRGVAVAYDSRYKSEEFAQETAAVLAANGIKVYLFDELKPVPELSFAVRELHTIAGVLITASHNPKEYNGYKVYWEDGAQPVEDITDRISQETAKIRDYSAVKLISLKEAEQKGLLEYIGKEIEDKYIARIKKSSLNPELVSKIADTFKIIYSPLNGAGNKPVRRILSEVGYKNVFVVKEQEMPDPQFTTCNPPNPEKKGVFELGIKMANSENVDFIIATDPDSDRLGAVVRNMKGEFEVIVGNQIACLILEYILSQKKQKGLLKKKGVVVKSMVSTELARAITDYYGVELVDVPVGFKNIAEQMNKIEKDDAKEFVFGFEESYGYLAGTHARDKDAVEASMLLSEVAAYYRDKGMSLYEGLQEIYKKYGYYKEANVSFTLKGIEGTEKINAAMKTLRENKHSHFGSIKVKKIRDYSEGRVYDLTAGSVESIDTRKVNVIYFELDNGESFVIRPSGTEPLIKLYFGAKGNTGEEAEKRIEMLKGDILPEIRKLLNLEE